MLHSRPFGLFYTRFFLGLFALFVNAALAADTGTADDKEEPVPARFEQGEPVWVSRSGPWGELEVRSLYLEAPDSLVAGLKQPNSTTSWNFPGASEDTLTALFVRAGLPSDMRAQLLNPQHILIHEGVWTLFIDPELLLALTQDQRSVIYRELSASSLNPMHAAPAYVVAENPEDWLSDAHITDEQKKMVRQLLWKDYDMLAFSDVSILLAGAKTDAEIAKVFKFMTRVRSLMVTLKLSPGSDPKPLAEYWTAEGRETECLPLILSATERQGMGSIDLTHLLPPMARTYLYTFPTLESGAEGRLPDCQWTALNFFHSTPHDYFLDARLTATHLTEAYETVEGPYRYGDVLEFIDGRGDAQHACVFLADNIVFTKNGEGMIKPWIMMWLADVKKLYQREDCRVVAYRMKPSAS
ncbi:MAG: hypothetical protein JWO08_9 [Verrucomicrobiaceae bacterium]|nr:hypothetical protein [Verrucomicrobiaceae bacterium]